MTLDATTAALTATDRRELETLETRIAEGLQTFLTVGESLRTIRDRALYRIEYPTFDSYCSKRWGMGGRRAYQLIAAAEVVEDIQTIAAETENPIGAIENAEFVNHGSQTEEPAPMPDSERQARPLTELDTPAEKAEAWQEAVASAPKRAGKPKVTAKAVKQAVEKVKAKRREPEAVAEPEAPAVPATPAEPWAPFNADVEKHISALRSISRQLNQLFEIKEGIIGNRWAAAYSVMGTTGALNTLIRNLENGMPAEAAPDAACGFISARVQKDRQRFAKSA